MQDAFLSGAISLAGQGYGNELRYCRRAISGEESGLNVEPVM
jgi:hypothetical protein